MKAVCEVIVTLALGAVLLALALGAGGPASLSFPTGIGPPPRPTAWWPTKTPIQIIKPTPAPEHEFFLPFIVSQTGRSFEEETK